MQERVKVPCRHIFYFHPRVDFLTGNAVFLQMDFFFQGCWAETPYLLHRDLGHGWNFVSPTRLITQHISPRVGNLGKISAIPYINYACIAGRKLYSF